MIPNAEEAYHCHLFGYILKNVSKINDKNYINNTQNESQTV